MANIFDKFLDSMKLYDEDEEEEEEVTEQEDRYEEEEEEEEPKRRLFGKRQAAEPEEEEEELPKPAPKARAGRNVTPIRSTGRAAMEVCMVKPSSMEDARDICDMLLSGRAVVINMEGVQVDLAQRIIDFSSGACYSIDGNLQKISSYIFIITPNSIELSGDFQNVLASGAMMER